MVHTSAEAYEANTLQMANEPGWDGSQETLVCCKQYMKAGSCAARICHCAHSDRESREALSKESVMRLHDLTGM